MKIRVLSCAEWEFVNTVDRYNAERSGLGYEFAEEVNAAFERIRAFPRLGRCSLNVRADASSAASPTASSTRSSDRILVVAIMHLKRDPQTWRQRAKC